jgi:hypothetical protein
MRGDPTGQREAFSVTEKYGVRLSIVSAQIGIFPVSVATVATVATSLPSTSHPPRKTYEKKELKLCVTGSALKHHTIQTAFMPITWG